MGIIIPENLQAVFLEIPAGYFKNRPVHAPVQLQRHGRNAPVGKRRVCGSCRYKVDIRARKLLVLRRKSPAAQCHIISPVLSCSSQSAAPRLKPCIVPRASGGRSKCPSCSGISPRKAAVPTRIRCLFLPDCFPRHSLLFALPFHHLILSLKHFLKSPPSGRYPPPCGRADHNSQRSLKFHPRSRRSSLFRAPEPRRR